MSETQPTTAAQQTFRQLLAQNTDEVRSYILASGHYIGTVKTFEFGVSRTKQTPQVQFLLSVEEACADVDTSLNEGLNLSQFELRKTFYITPKALKMLSNALDAILGHEQGRSFDVRLPDTRGARVMFAVTQRDDEQGNPAFNDVGTILAAAA